MLEQIMETEIDMSERQVAYEGPGIIILSSSLQLLHMNRRAGVLLGDLDSLTPETRKAIGRSCSLPPLLVRLADKILCALRQRYESADTRKCEINYVVVNSVKQVMMRGIGLPRGDRFESAHVVFVLSDTKGYRLNIG
ncbi:MAG TPA: hypothetical protein VLA67_14855 [Nitrospiraceae bacterium]|nr:hypothetical protein [Nitrospiraceae bacterium]